MRSVLNKVVECGRVCLCLVWRVGVAAAVFCAAVLPSADAVWARQTAPFKGRLDPAARTFLLEVGAGVSQPPLRLEVEKASQGAYDVILTIVDWQAGLFTLSTVINGSFTISDAGNDGTPSLAGRLISGYTLVNRRPFDDADADFALYEGEIAIASLRLGPYLISGKVAPGLSWAVDLTARLESASLAEFAALVDDGVGMTADGQVSGEIRFSGTVDKLQIRGRISTYNGQIDGNAYRSAQIQFSGIYPLVYVENSVVTMEDGLSLEVQGVLDLSDLKNFRDQMGKFVCSPLVSQRGKTLEWTFKRMQSDQRSGSTELKYMIQRNDTPGLGLRRDVEMLGVQRSLEF